VKTHGWENRRRARDTLNGKWNSYVFSEQSSLTSGENKHLGLRRLKAMKLGGRNSLPRLYIRQSTLRLSGGFLSIWISYDASPLFTWRCRTLLQPRVETQKAVISHRDNLSAIANPERIPNYRCSIIGSSRDSITPMTKSASKNSRRTIFRWEVMGVPPPSPYYCKRWAHTRNAYFDARVA